jgi:biotin carboxylase
MKPTVIVVGGGRSEYRGYILDRISRRYRLVLLSPQEPTWEREYVSDYAAITAGDDEGIVATAKRVHDAAPVAGVVTYHEACVELVAVIGHALGVPHCDPVAAARCRDKLAAREALARAGVPSARFALVHDAAEARAAAAEIGYPVVVKPRALTASFGVSKVDDPASMAEAVDTAGANAFPEPWGFRRGLLVEEFLDGQEISVDCAAWQGHVEPVIFARKVLGYPPHFEEVGHIVAPAEQLVDDPERVRAVVRAAHRAMGIDNTVTHSEVRLTADGPRLIEVNGRLGGDVIPLVAQAATGLNLPLASADIATGRAPDLGTTGTRIGGVRFFYTDASGTVADIGLAGESAEPDRPDRPDQPDWLDRVSWLVRPGEVLDPLPARLHFARTGYAIVLADTPEECAQRLVLMAGRHVLDLEVPS